MKYITTKVSKSAPVFVSFSNSKSNRMELSEFYKAKAFEDFGEDDLKRNQSLEQFREWIRKQTHIKSGELSKFSLVKSLSRQIKRNIHFLQMTSFCLHIFDGRSIACRK